MDDYHRMHKCFFVIVIFASLLLLAAPAWSANKPELQLKFLDIGPAAPNPPLTDRPTSFYALVVNTGTRTIKGPFTVTLELDGKAVKAWQFPIKHEIKDYKPGTQNSIPPGKGRLYQYVATLKAGKHTVRWHVNTAVKNVIKATVEAQLPPDLVVTIWPTGDRVLAYKETEWNVEVKNIGGGKAAGPFVTLFDSTPSNQEIAPLVFPKGKYLGKDEAYVFKVTQVYNSLDPITVSAVVDYYGDITEVLPFGDDNNRSKEKYAPQYVDLEVTTLEIKPAHVTTTEPIEVSCTVQNKGTMDAAKPFNVAILVKDESSGSISLIDAVQAPPLPVDASAQLTKNIVLSRAGTYTVQVIADAAMIGLNPNVLGKQYSEPDEKNNSKEIQFTVSQASTPSPLSMPLDEFPDQRVTSGCKPGKGIVTLYRIVSECSQGSTQPYTGIIPIIKKGSLKRITNTTTQWKINLVDSFNLKGIEGNARCEKYGDHCWDVVPKAFLKPGESWVSTALNSLNAGDVINACLEPLTNDAFPLEIEIEYEYECMH
jgi:hypothetical protein